MGYVQKNQDGGVIHLMEERRSLETVKSFVGLSSKDYAGLVITRTHPNLLGYLRGVDVDSYWLTDELGDKQIQAHDLTTLVNTVITHAKKHEKSVVLLDGIEYLTRHTSPDTVLRALDTLDDRLSELVKDNSKEVHVLLRVNSKALDPRVLESLRTMSSDNESISLM